MGLSILVADAYEIHRLGLRVIYEGDSEVSWVQEVATEAEIRTQLREHSFDLVTVNQALVTDITILPPKRFLIIVTKPNMYFLRLSYLHGARGYVSINTPAEILRAILHTEKHSFLVEPTFMPWFMESVMNNVDMSNPQPLTPMEKNIVCLLRAGFKRSRIARKLKITDTMLEKYIRSIFDKNRFNQ